MYKNENKRNEYKTGVERYPSKRGPNEKTCSGNTEQVGIMILLTTIATNSSYLRQNNK